MKSLVCETSGPALDFAVAQALKLRAAILNHDGAPKCFILDRNGEQALYHFNPTEDYRHGAEVLEALKFEGLQIQAHIDGVAAHLTFRPGCTQHGATLLEACARTLAVMVLGFEVDIPECEG